MLVKGRAKLLSSLCQLLFHGVGFESKCVPFILEHSKERRYRGEGWRSGSDNARCLELDKIIGRECLTGNRIFAVLRYVCFDQAFLENSTCNIVSVLRRKSCY